MMHDVAPTRQRFLSAESFPQKNFSTSPNTKQDYVFPSYPQEVVGGRSRGENIAPALRRGPIHPSSAASIGQTSAEGCSLNCERRTECAPRSCRCLVDGEAG